MRKFNIVLALSGSEKENLHAKCFRETAELLKCGLEDLGFEVLFADGLQKECTNIILGYHFLESKKLPPAYDCIIYQLEELGEDGPIPVSFLETLRSPNAVVWDFSERNIEFLAKHNIKAVLKPLGFHPKLLRINHQDSKDIDVLFYGSINERRLRVLRELDRKFNTKTLFGVYGAERDNWIGRAKIVISIYYYETKLFDDIRIGYLLNNKAFTIVEDSPNKKYQDFIVYEKYERLVESCEYFLNNDSLRSEKIERAFQAFSDFPEKYFLQTALAKSL